MYNDLINFLFTKQNHKYDNLLFNEDSCVDDGKFVVFGYKAFCSEYGSNNVNNFIKFYYDNYDKYYKYYNKSNYNCHLYYFNILDNKLFYIERNKISIDLLPRWETPDIDAYVCKIFLTR